MKLVVCLLLLLCLSGMVQAAPLPVAPVASLATALNPDGTLRPGVTGSFDARQFRMHTAPDGRPAFSPAQVAGTGDEGWQAGFTLPNGADDAVYAVAMVGTDLYIGGDFKAAGGVPASYIARWNGTTWSTLGPTTANGVNGVNGRVLALAVAANGDLYVGGNFTQAGSVGANNVARWNGTAWSALGLTPYAPSGNYSYVTALAVAPTGDVYATGSFSQAGGATANNVAKWNGTAWSTLGTGLTGSNTTYAPVGYALAVATNGDVYVGGNFTQAGSVPTSGVAKWNGTAWSALGAGVGAGTPTGYMPIVSALAVAPNGDLYAGGSFAQAGSVSANGIARWDGTAWSSLGTGLSVTYYNYSPLGAALAIAPNGDVYVGGNFTRAGGVAANGVAKWNGTAWSTLGAGLGGNVQLAASALLLTSTGGLYAGGNFTKAGGASANYVARWSGTAWSTLGTGQGNGRVVQAVCRPQATPSSAIPASHPVD